MARAKRTWNASGVTSLLPTIRRRLKEIKADDSFWKDRLLLDLWNEALDLRAMDLGDAFEGWTVTVFQSKTTVAEGDYLFPLSIETARIKKVAILDVDTNELMPLMRDEKRRQVTTIESQAVRAGHTYKLTQDSIMVSPPFGESGKYKLWTECENVPDLFIDANSALADGWPLTTEHMLVLDTVVRAAETEEAKAQGVRLPERFMLSHRAYEQRWLRHIESRSDSPQQSTRFNLGG